jgi:serine/threonine protein kinase
VLDSGEDDGRCFVVLEYLRGHSVLSLLQRAGKRWLSPQLICRVAMDALAGLSGLHGATDDEGRPIGLVHRDVSPSNIVVTPEAHVKLLDLGIAKATLRPAWSERTQAGQLKGKFSYMSPEQTMGQAIDSRTDIFSAGVVLWELLTRHRLFKRGNMLDTLRAVRTSVVGPPSSYEPSIPVELDRIVLRALERDRERRYQSAEEMRFELSRVARKQGWRTDRAAILRELETIDAETYCESPDDEELCTDQVPLLSGSERVAIGHTRGTPPPAWLLLQRSSLLQFVFGVIAFVALLLLLCALRR